MKANEYKMKYESIEEFRRMAYKNIVCWEEQLSEIESSNCYTEVRKRR